MKIYIEKIYFKLLFVLGIIVWFNGIFIYLNYNTFVEMAIGIILMDLSLRRIQEYYKK